MGKRSVSEVVLDLNSQGFLVAFTGRRGVDHRWLLLKPDWVSNEVWQVLRQPYGVSFFNNEVYFRSAQTLRRFCAKIKKPAP